MIEDETERAEHTWFSPNEKTNAFLTAHGMPQISTGISLADLIRRPHLGYSDLKEIDTDRPALPRSVIYSVEVNLKYEGYIKRQIAEVKRREKYERTPIPADIDYGSVKGLRIEAAQKLSKFRPMNIGQASRISGVSPADISVLLIRLSVKKGNNE